ncbi:MAG: CsbD family protein [Paraburkholderia sp.]|nr:CsbD family protein [Paraburkholderia sp.]
METTEADGSLREAAGKVQQAAGDLLGDAGVQVSGKARELRAKAQQLYADLASVARESTLERPLTALAIAAGAGFILGLLRAASRQNRD